MSQVSNTAEAPDTKPVLISETNADDLVARKVKLSPRVLKKNRIITGSVNDAATTAYKVLRTQVLRRMKANGWNTLAVTSTSPSEGKTLTSINLAVSFAKWVNYPVLLADLDLHKPAVHRYLGIKPERAIDDYISKNTPLEDIWLDPGIRQLLVLPARDTVVDSSEMLSSPAMGRMVTELRARFSKGIIVFDMPPLLYTDDVLAFSPFVDAVLLVVEERKTKRTDLRMSLELLDDLPVVGTVLNKSRTANKYYY